MPFFVLVIGAILVVAAIRNNQGDLFSALAADVPPFITWATAIVVIGSIGFIPNLKPVSRGLLALILVVILLNNYQQILAGFTSAWTTTAKGAGDGGSGTGTAKKHGQVSVSSNISSPLGAFSGAFTGGSLNG